LLELIINEQLKHLKKQDFRLFDRENIFITMTDGQHILTIPRANPINAYTMGTIIKGSGLTIEEFKKLL
jgi:hypothetical protein